LDGGLVPILCVGETLAERESGETESVILRQVNEVMKIVGVEGIGRSIVAYEPVWAIGTGKSATAEEAEAVHKLIRNRLAEESELVGEKVRILYGGSVKPENAKALFAMKNIDGALVGGASLDANAFLAICDAAAR
jgi:triosephosphate isomerase